MGHSKNKLTIRILSILSSALLFAACAQHAEVTDVQTLASPSGNMEMTFQLNAEGTPQYALNYEGQKVILTGVNEKVYSAIERTGIVAKVGKDNILNNIDEALRHAERLTKE